MRRAQATNTPAGAVAPTSGPLACQPVGADIGAPMSERYDILEQHRGGRFRRERTDSLERVAERLEACWRQRIHARAIDVDTERVIGEASNDMPHVDERTGRRHAWGWWSEQSGRA